MFKAFFFIIGLAKLIQIHPVTIILRWLVTAMVVIWLLCCREWGIAGISIVGLLFGTWLITLGLIPRLFCIPLAVSKNGFLSFIGSFLKLGYTYLLAALWFSAIGFYFVTSVHTSASIPAFILAFMVGVKPFNDFGQTAPYGDLEAPLTELVIDTTFSIIIVCTLFFDWSFGHILDFMIKAFVAGTCFQASYAKDLTNYGMEAAYGSANRPESSDSDSVESLLSTTTK